MTTHHADPTRFTDQAWWDTYWEGTPLPQEFTEQTTSRYIRSFLEPFDRFFPHDPSLSMLEIGGAPGRYLAYFHRRFGYAVHALEYSSVGYELARRNLQLLGIPATVRQGDMFDTAVDLPRCDIVYSLGLIEHFDDPLAVAEAHLRFVKPGGLLVIGAPNLQGVGRFLFQKLSPSILESHHPPSTDPDLWAAFESRLGLEVLWKGYTCGFEPGTFHRLERKELAPRALWVLLQGLTRVWDTKALDGLRDHNSRAWSSNVIAFYRAPESVGESSAR